MGTQPPSIITNYAILKTLETHKGQSMCSAMDEPCPGKATSVITISPIEAKFLSCFFK